MPKVFISRNLKTNSPFRQELEAAGMEVIGQSLIHFSPIAFEHIPTTDWLFFYSRNAVKYFFEGLKELDMPNLKDLAYLKSKQWAVMGAGTAKALQNKGIPPNYVGTGHPKSTATNFEAIIKNQKILFIRAKTSKKSVQKLITNQTQVKDLVVYENSIKQNFELPTCDFLVFTSPLNTQAYFQKYPWQKQQKVVAIGNTTAKSLTTLGISDIKIALKPTEACLAKTVLGIDKKEKKSK